MMRTPTRATAALRVRAGSPETAVPQKLHAPVLLKQVEQAVPALAALNLRLCDARRAELVKQVIAAAESAGVQLLAENALEGGIYNAEALQRMLTNSKHFQRCALPRESLSCPISAVFA